MKAKTILLVLLSMATLCNAQQQVTRQEAINAAVNTMYSIGRPDLSTNKIQNVFSTTERGDTLLYEVQFITGESVLLSGNHSCLPVLGYIIQEEGDTLQYTGPILDSSGGCPEGLRLLLDCYKEEIMFCFDSMNRICGNPQWEQFQSYGLLRANKDRVSVGPLLSSKWGQDIANQGPDLEAYNYYVDPDLHEQCNNTNHRCSAGCAAVAMAQIMYYYDSHSNVPDNQNNPGQLVPYQWSEMRNKLIAPNDYENNQSYMKKKKAIAKLVHDCGVKVGMSYCNDGCSSSALPSNVPSALYYFGYNDASLVLKSSKTQTEWENLLKLNLDNKHPVFYFGYDSENLNNRNGHAFICDGYKSNHLFHFNMGHYGDNDGWFTTSAIPDQPLLHYRYDQGIVHQFYPKDEDECWYNIIFEYDKTTSGEEFHAFHNISHEINHTLVVEGPNPVVFEAGNEISLHNGFWAKPGSELSARIRPCSESSSREAWGDQTVKDELPTDDIIGSDETKSISVYPNPIKDEFIINLPSEHTTVKQIEIYNIYGSLIMRLEQPETTSIKVSNIQAGLYVIRICTNVGKQYHAKVVKY